MEQTDQPPVEFVPTYCRDVPECSQEKIEALFAKVAKTPRRPKPKAPGKKEHAANLEAIRADELLPGFDPNELGLSTWKDPDAQDGPPPLPGPKAKQGEQMFQAINWLALPWKPEGGGAPGLGALKRLAFMTLTMGDWTTDILGKPFFQQIYDGKEAEKRFNSLLTNVIRKRYKCGVIVRERHESRAIHYHLVCLCAHDIRTGAQGQDTLDFDKCFHKVEHLCDYSTANAEIKAEWKFWREHAEAYGFGRCNMQPVRKNGEAAARYMAKYISKTWMKRNPADKGARIVRYFGRWTGYTPPPAGELPDDRRKIHYTKAGELRAVPPPISCRFGWMRPQAQAWREGCKQVEIISAAYGNRITEDNVKAKSGRYWAWHWTKKFRAVLLVPENGLAATALEGIKRHNLDVENRLTRPIAGKTYQAYQHILQTTDDFWRHHVYDFKLNARHLYEVDWIVEATEADLNDVMDAFPEHYADAANN